jgi:hypothetical protein
MAVIERARDVEVDEFDDDFDEAVRPGAATSDITFLYKLRPGLASKSFGIVRRSLAPVLAHADMRARSTVPPSPACPSSCSRAPASRPPSWRAGARREHNVRSRCAPVALWLSLLLAGRWTARRSRAPRRRRAHWACSSTRASRRKRPKHDPHCHHHAIPTHPHLTQSKRRGHQRWRPSPER